MAKTNQLQRKREEYQKLDKRDRRRYWTDGILNNALYILMFIFIVYTAIKNKNFLSAGSIANIISLVAASLPMALGIAGCIVLTGTDLSGGRVVGLTAAVAGALLQDRTISRKLFSSLPEITTGWIILTVLAVVLIGAIIGLVNGFFVAKFSLHPFIVTLATQLITYGLKGLCAYTSHANALLREDPELDAFIQSTLAKTLDDSLTAEELTALTLETGKFGVRGMALLDQANTETFGNPEITKVNIGTGKNPGILVSGHDLHDLEMLLEQTKGTGVDVYTHSEMLPAHYYPAFKKYPNFAGNYGNAWWKQKEEFESFNGPILMTTNCIVPPKDSYKDRIYTTGATGYPGCTHITPGPDGKKDFSQIISHAKRCAAPTEIEHGEIVGGFAHNQVIALADQIVEAVKSGAIRKFVVMAGCDGRAKSRSYYTDFAQALPKDTVILTAGCAKYRYNKLNLGDINGIPRVLDAGQCNDSYSLAVIAMKLQEVFGLDDINELPIIYNIAWYEQKAVIVLLALLSLGVKNIHLGPTLPAFLSPNVTKILINNFGIAGINRVEEDMELFFGK